MRSWYWSYLLFSLKFLMMLQSQILIGWSKLSQASVSWLIDTEIGGAGNFTHYHTQLIGCEILTGQAFAKAPSHLCNAKLSSYTYWVMKFDQSELIRSTWTQMANNSMPKTLSDIPDNTDFFNKKGWRRVCFAYSRYLWAFLSYVISSSTHITCLKA